jgi:hypothetical protein
MLEKFEKNGLKNLAFYAGGKEIQTVRGKKKSKCDSFETDGSKKNADGIWYGDTVKRFDCPTAVE